MFAKNLLLLSMVGVVVAKDTAHGIVDNFICHAWLVDESSCHIQATVHSVEVTLFGLM